MKHADSYREVSAPWDAPHVLATYARLTKSLHVRVPRNLAIDSRYPFAQARHALHQLSLGIPCEDQACVWLCAEFVVSDCFFSGSGYLKAGMARRLKQVPLDEQTKDLLRKGILDLWKRAGYRREWREYCNLLRRIGFERYEKQFASLLPDCHPGTGRFVGRLVDVQFAD